MNTPVRAEINVTPLVDVCLVLLIIFMVVTPLINSGPVETPQAPTPDPWPPEPARSKVTLTYGPPSFVFVDSDPTPLDDAALSVLLRALHAQDPRREIALRADRKLAYGAVKHVLVAIREAGFPAVGLVAERPGAAAPR
jgi:biopolymer transport protein TolR